MKSQVLSLALASSAVRGVLATVSYDGAKAIRIPVGEDVIPVMKIIDQLQLPVWKGVGADGVPKANSNVDLVVPAEKAEEFGSMINGINIEVMHEDLGASIAEESSAADVSAEAVNLGTWFNAYHPYADHLQFLTTLQSMYPSNSEIVTSGASVAGRAITGLHFYGAAKGKPAVVLHGTVHAREWISTMTVEYVIYNLLSNYTTNTEIKGFLDKYDFFVFPVVNPDGFVYTQTNDRLWRKNRQTAPNSNCLGRDVNRNWNYRWDGAGSSTNPCDETFKGSQPSDSPENQGLSAFLNNIQATQGVQLYMDIHSYSQLFMTPYGYSCTARVSTANANLATGAARAIEAVYGTDYIAGPLCGTLYQVAGGSIDYAQDVTKAKYVFTIELRDTGNYGFVLPPAQIRPTVLETWQGFRYLFTNMVL
ncbi:hypothetical protein HYALB_00006395 [Hymenoscyphus albidus]|uniref:Carboxypeptidase M14A n=1 Tax=Hymenoscyphus albidus TaxID=595503 RepID=A0A9N9LII8_9HELO|nr:hypothetical protein HYALB_00006395 [Hymenoscyphus albidus]